MILPREKNYVVDNKKHRYLEYSCLTRVKGGCVCRRVKVWGSLSSDVFERRTSTGSDPFSLLVSPDATVFILPSVLILIETICPKICSKSRLKSAKRPIPVDVRRSKTSLLKLPIGSGKRQRRSRGPILLVPWAEGQVGEDPGNEAG